MAKAKTTPIKGLTPPTGVSVADREVPTIAALRYKTASDRPYFSTLLFQLIPVEVKNDPRMPTMAVDKHWRMYYNPEMLEKEKFEDLVGVLIHELNHLIRDHEGRRGNRDAIMINPETGSTCAAWNIAGDAEINDDILAEKLTLPGDCILPKSLNCKDGEIAETYYESVIKNAKKFSVSFPGKGDGKDKKQGKTGSGACGSAAGDGDYPWEIDGEDKATGKVDEISKELARNNTAKEILEHQKTIGNVPGDLLRWAKQRLKSKVDWKKELRATISRELTYISGMVDYTRQKFSRRQSAFPRILMYGFHAPVPSVGVVIDTSGSMSDADLGQALAEVDKVLKTTNAQITLMSADAEVNSCDKIKSLYQVKLKGGGGTDMVEAMDYCSRLKVAPKLIIVITDGYTGWPKSNIYKFRSVAVITRKGGSHPPKWMKTIPAYVDDSDPE